MEANAMGRDTGAFSREVPALIAVDKLVKEYEMGRQTLRILDEVSFEIRRGEFVAILGPSGSGKSTLMNILGCIDTATSGTYRLGGEDIREHTEDTLADIRNRQVGFIFQKFNLLPRYTALHNTEIPLILRGQRRREATEKAREMLELVGLGDRTHHRPIELSGGQQQRVAIARALVGEPELLLADEPTGNLDSHSGQEIMDLIDLLLHEKGNTIVLITHDLHVAERAERILRIADGQLVSDERTKLEVAG
jgi:putative ABC transport system ATP-binding protein